MKKNKPAPASEEGLLSNPAMEPDEALSNEQQDDLRDILGTLHKFLKKHNLPIMEDSEVFVTKHTAAIVVNLGQCPPAHDERAVSQYGERRSAARKVFRDFYTEHAVTGSALSQNTEDSDEGVIARYRLIPNDPIGAGRLLKKLIVRLEKTYAQRNQATCA